jgi:hypothetical protein
MGAIMTRHMYLAVLVVGVLVSIHGSAAKAEGDSTFNSPAQQSGATSENKSSWATGTVSQVSCTSGVKIQLDTLEGTRTLRSQLGTQFRITPPTHAETNANPCPSLKGLRVKVQFIPDDTKGMSGAIEQVQILPPEDAPKAASLVASPRKEETSKTSAAMTGTGTSTSEGMVKAVRCEGKELRITLAVRDLEFKLHARDYTRVDIQEEVAFQEGNYDPCAKLNGHNAIVTYVLVEKKPYDGEIMAIEVGH